MIEYEENKMYGNMCEQCTVLKEGNDRNLEISKIHIKKKIGEIKLKVNSGIVDNITNDIVNRFESVNNIGIVYGKIGKFISTALIILSLLGAMSVAQAETDYPVVAFVGDAKPAIGYDPKLLIDDFNQIIPQSPNGYVNATVMVGDMNHISDGSKNTDNAYAASTVKDISAFFVVGNHELENIVDLPAIRSKFSSYAYSPNAGPNGSKETTYSFDIGDMHIIVLNQYWDGNSNGICDSGWSVPSSGLNADDSCMKYGSGNGGFIPDALFNWIENDLKKNTKSWIIVTGHEPLYPWGRHMGDSLDNNKSNRDRLEKLFISNNVTTFIGGHTHVTGIKNYDGIYHANVGVIGGNVGTESSGDHFATIIYTYVNETGNFVIEEKYEDSTWSNTGTIMFAKDPIIEKPPTVIKYALGDADQSGGITSADALLYLRFAVGQDISPFHIDSSDDVTCDNGITAADALMILRKAVGQDVVLGCG